MRTQLAQRLREARKARGLTQDEVASRLGIHRVQVSKWEREKAPQRPRDETLVKLAKLYGVTVEWLHGAPEGGPAQEVSRETHAVTSGDPRVESLNLGAVVALQRARKGLDTLLDQAIAGAAAVSSAGGQERQTRRVAEGGSQGSAADFDAEAVRQQLARLETILARTEEEMGLPEPAPRSTMTLEERLQALARGIAILRGQALPAAAPASDPVADERAAG